MRPSVASINSETTASPSEGLLTTFTDPKGNTNTFAYDPVGRLAQDTNAGNGGWTLARTVQGQDTTVSMTTAEGRSMSFQVDPLATGDRQQPDRMR